MTAPKYPFEAHRHYGGNTDTVATFASRVAAEKYAAKRNTDSYPFTFRVSVREETDND